MNNLIALACWRTGSDYAMRTSADLTIAITAPIALRSLNLLTLLIAATQAGAIPAELHRLYQYAKYVEDAENVLRTGALLETQAMLAVAATIGAWTTPTVMAVQTVIAANALSLLDLVAIELNTTAPINVTAADIDMALNRA